MHFQHTFEKAKALYHGLASHQLSEAYYNLMGTYCDFSNKKMDPNIVIMNSHTFWVTMSTHFRMFMPEDAYQTILLAGFRLLVPVFVKDAKADDRTREKKELFGHLCTEKLQWTKCPMASAVVYKPKKPKSKSSTAKPKKAKAQKKSAAKAGRGSGRGRGRGGKGKGKKGDKDKGDKGDSKGDKADSKGDSKGKGGKRRSTTSDGHAEAGNGNDL